MDIKDAFHQVEIHPGSRHITTFITSKDKYRYKRLMFGISCAPEIFQKRWKESSLDVNFIDDIVVYGDNEEEHDRRLKHTSKALQENNILLNSNKCVFKIPSIEFLLLVIGTQSVIERCKVIEKIQKDPKF